MDEGKAEVPDDLMDQAPKQDQPTENQIDSVKDKNVEQGEQQQVNTSAATEHGTSAQPEVDNAPKESDGNTNYQSAEALLDSNEAGNKSDNTEEKKEPEGDSQKDMNTVGDVPKDDKKEQSNEAENSATNQQNSDQQEGRTADQPVDSTAVEQPDAKQPGESASAEQPSLEQPAETAAVEQPDPEQPVETAAAEQPDPEQPAETAAAEQPNPEQPAETAAAEQPDPEQSAETAAAERLNAAEENQEATETDPHPAPKTSATSSAVQTGNGVKADESSEAVQDDMDDNQMIVANEIPSATVKFVLLPTAQVATMKCALNQSLAELKEHFAVELKIPANVILLLYEGSNMDDGRTLADLGVGPNGTVQLEMQSADPINTPIRAFKRRQNYVMPDVITVRVETEPKRFKDIVVEVERATHKKPFLGGFKHKETGVEYHNASAQTSQRPRPPSDTERYCRDTQTYNMKHMRQQTSEDTSTQMTKIGVFVSNMSDKLLIPGKYTTAEQHQMMILKKVIILQKYWRRWLAQKFVHKIQDDMRRRVEWEKSVQMQKRQEKEERIRREFERRMNPKTKEDFDLLYAALEKWRQEELTKIDQTLTGAERKAALCQLLDQQTQLIASIGRHKQDAGVELKQKSIQSFLEKASAPKKWRGPDGNYTEMDTPYTIRAQELRDIYNSICMKYLTQDERLDVLLTLKHTVKEHDCKLTREIIELIDREADLLMRGVTDSNLDGLRKRISTLFLQYIKTPTFNPEAARLLKVPQDPTQLRQNIYYCASCNRYLSSVEFQLSTNSRTVGRCRNCRNLDNEARVRQDYSHYRLMLKDLRQLEESYGDDSKVAFLLQENDLRYLVEKIWSNQSILSAWDDIYDLVLVRWDKYKEWSPWNCVLLTKEESSAHERLESLDEGYGKELVHKVLRKHALARNYFSRLPGMSEFMRHKISEPVKGAAGSSISVN